MDPLPFQFIYSMYIYMSANVVCAPTECVCSSFSLFIFFFLVFQRRVSRIGSRTNEKEKRTKRFRFSLLLASRSDGLKSEFM